jgi:hypothetical protein
MASQAARLQARKALLQSLKVELHWSGLRVSIGSSKTNRMRRTYLARKMDLTIADIMPVAAVFEPEIRRVFTRKRI